MKLNPIGYTTNSLGFKGALSTKQKEKEAELKKQVREIENKEGSLRIAKLMPQAIPSSSEIDTGIGYMSSKEADKIYGLLSDEFDANAVKFMPFGELTDLDGFNKDNERPPLYGRSGLSVGADFINIPALATKEYGDILSKQDLQKVIDKHKNQGNEYRIDYKSNLGFQNQENYPLNDVIGIAYNNFLHAPHPTRELKALRKEFEEFKHDPFYGEICDRVALFPYLKDWGSGQIENIKVKNLSNTDGLNLTKEQKENPETVVWDKNIFIGMDTDPTEQQLRIFEKIKEKYEGAIDFYKFKQFLAQKSVDKGVELVHNHNMKAFGDMGIGWSYPETRVFPDAFKWINEQKTEYAKAGFALPALKYEDLLEDKTCSSAAHKLLRAKLTHMLKHYDGIRLDVGWEYIHPKYENSDFRWSDGSNKRPEPCDVIPKFIQQVARDVKGDDFNQSDIIYECEANLQDFNLEDRRIVDILNNIEGRAIFSTENEHQNDAKGWGNIAYLRNAGINTDKIVAQTNNHDGEGVANCANNRNRSSVQVGAMLRSFNMPGDQWWKLKDDNDHRAHAQKYSTARFSEADLAGNTAILINDLLGKTDKIDYHANDFDKDYKMRLERNLEENYNKNLMNGYGYNYAEVKAFNGTNNGLREKYPELYSKLDRYAAYRRLNNGIYTTEQADKSKFAKLDIENMSIDEINQLNLSV